jgi:hypothetical protein
MATRKNLNYQVQVSPGESYEIKVRIGDAQSGDHNVFGTCPFDTKPEKNNPEWKSKLGNGSLIKGKTLHISSATQNNNPNTDNVSVRLFINGNQIAPLSGNNVIKAATKEVVYFNQKIDFV